MLRPLSFAPASRCNVKHWKRLRVVVEAVALPVLFAKIGEEHLALPNRIQLLLINTSVPSHAEVSMRKELANSSWT